jgi:hypothetical protein
MAERSPVLLRRVNDLMREGRWGQTDPELFPFFCECRRPDCYVPVWLTADGYDERRAKAQEPLILPGHEPGGYVNATVEARTGRAPVRSTRS